MNKKRIELGDKVRVIFGGGEAFTGTVEYMPHSAGDSWIIIGTHGSVNYIQHFRNIALIEKGD